MGRRSSIRLSHCVSLRAVSFPTVIEIDIYEERHLPLSRLRPVPGSRISSRDSSRCVITLRIFFFFFWPFSIASQFENCSLIFFFLWYFMINCSLLRMIGTFFRFRDRDFVSVNYSLIFYTVVRWFCLILIKVSL